MLSVRLKELEDDGELTSGTASCVEEFYSREQRYMEMKGDSPEAAAADDGDGVKTPPRWASCPASAASVRCRSRRPSPVEYRSQASTRTKRFRNFGPSGQGTVVGALSTAGLYESVRPHSSY